MNVFVSCFLLVQLCKVVVVGEVTRIARGGHREEVSRAGITRSKSTADGLFLEV